MSFTFIIIGALIIELFTIILRFGFDLHSRKIQHHAGLPIRIHHLYVGIIVLIVGLIIKHQITTDVGIAIALSDLIHHLIILPITKNGIDFL